MKKILFIIGTRPEVVKLCPVIKIFEQHKSFETIVLTTGQQKSLLDNMLKEFNILPQNKFRLEIKNADISEHVGKLIQAINKFIHATKPDMIFVQGDTSTAFTSAFVGFLNNIPIAHIEAGLRSFNLDSPFPEEGYRQMISRLATFNFSPTILAKSNLLSEGISPDKIYVVGNTIVDSIVRNLDGAKQIKVENKVLITLHRRENFGEPLIEICQGIYNFAAKNPTIKIKIILHPNPNSNNTIRLKLGNLKNIELINPLSYKKLLEEIISSIFVLTDSGGIQEECNILNIPLLVARTETERPEVLSSGKLIGTSSTVVCREMANLYDTCDEKSREVKFNFKHFGDGTSATQIIRIVENLL